MADTTTAGNVRIPSDDDPPLAWALYYLSLGWVLSYFPPGTKGPDTKGWNTPAQWIDTPAKVQARWAETPTYGMGLIHAAAGTVAIDIDAIEPSRLIFTEFGLDLDEILALAPRIRGALTGRAKAIFRSPEGPPLPLHRAAWIHPTDRALSVTLFELRAGPVHDVLPPSVHPDGHHYEWSRAPWEFETFPQLPEPLLKFWRAFPQLREQIAALSPWAKALPALPERRVRSEPTQGAEGDHNDVIGAFNRAHSVSAILEEHGYKQLGKRYLAPASKTGIPGVVVLDDRAYSHHASDRLADGHAHDAFDLYRIFDHGGDWQRAVHAAARLLDIPDGRNRAVRLLPATPKRDVRLLEATSEPGSGLRLLEAS